MGHSQRAGESVMQIAAEVVPDDGHDRTRGRADRRQREGEPADDREHELVEQEADARRRRPGDEQFEVAATTEDAEEEADGEDPEEAREPAHERDDGARRQERPQREDERDEESTRREDTADATTEAGESTAGARRVRPATRPAALAPGVVVEVVAEVVADHLAVEILEDLAVEVLEAFVGPVHAHPFVARIHRSFPAFQAGYPSRRFSADRPRTDMTDVSLDGRRFRSVENEDGEVDAATTFEYHGDTDLVWARYSGGPIRLGFLVGLRDGDTLFARYTQATTTEKTATGHTKSRIERLADDRVRLHEEWAWDSREGSGTSVVDTVSCNDLPAITDPAWMIAGKRLQPTVEEVADSRRA